MKQILMAGVLGLAACAGTPAGDFIPISDVDRMLSPEERQAVLAAGCPPKGWDRERLDGLRAAKFEIADEAERRSFALGITYCLSSEDPGLRDGIAFEALSHMLRERQLSDETMRELMGKLVTRLNGLAGLGFSRPFAALVLSEVARADRIRPFLSEDELVRLLLVDAQAWFINISDYRGFDETEGWRHGVAHGSDLLMQLALNPRIDAEGLRVIVSSVAVQVAPEGVSYIDGESERLARPVLYAASRGVMTEEEWTKWLMAIATPPEGVEVFGSERGLAWRHDTMAFLSALYVNVVIGSDKADDVMRPGLEAALKALP